MTRAVCVFLLVSGVSWPTIADEAKTPTAVLLVARAGLPDTNFKDSVVLVMNNIFPAPAGLILNRPTSIEVCAVLRKLLSRDRPIECLRIFIGYAGWTPDQLKAEIARGDWTLAPAETKTIFGRKSEHPWPEPQPPDDVHRVYQRHSTPACCPV